MYYSVISLEEGRAVLEGDDGRRFSLDQRELPPATCEGDVLEKREEGYWPAPEETAARKARIEKLFQKLRGQRPPRT